MTTYKIEDLIAATDISYVAERLGKNVIRKGKHTKMSCPFHGSDSDPSFILYNNGSYYCFGCGVHGSTIDLVRKELNMNFGEACEWLISEFGLMREHFTDDENPQKREKGVYINARKMEVLGIKNRPVYAYSGIREEGENLKKEDDVFLEKKLISSNPLCELYTEDKEAFDFLIKSKAKEKIQLVHIAKNLCSMAKRIINRQEIVFCLNEIEANIKETCRELI